MTARLGATIRRELDDGLLEELIFGTREPDEIAALVDGWCRDALGSQIAAYVFYRASVGSVHGVELHDGRRVVVKAVRPGSHAERMIAARGWTARLAADGYPCPRPLGEPREIGRGLAAAESWLDVGAPPDCGVRAQRRLIAVELAALLARGRREHELEVALPPTWTGRASGELYGEAHDPRFDFAGTAAGAAWIDEQAWAAKEVLARAAGALTFGHADWRAEHLRFVGEQLVATYDWDSAARDREPVFVGIAAHLFTTNWQSPALHRLPSVRELVEFVDDYEAARAERFDGAERAAVDAALTHALAYSARCEHSDEHKLGWTGTGIRALLRGWVACGRR